MQHANDNAPRLITLADTCTATCLSRTQIARLRLAGDFPSAIKLGERRIAFVRAEVEAWIDARIAARPANDNRPAQQAA